MFLNYATQRFIRENSKFLNNFFTRQNFSQILLLLLWHYNRGAVWAENPPFLSFAKSWQLYIPRADRSLCTWSFHCMRGRPCFRCPPTRLESNFTYTTFKHYRVDRVELESVDIAIVVITSKLFRNYWSVKLFTRFGWDHVIVSWCCYCYCNGKHIAVNRLYKHHEIMRVYALYKGSASC